VNRRTVKELAGLALRLVEGADPGWAAAEIGQIIVRDAERELRPPRRRWVTWHQTSGAFFDGFHLAEHCADIGPHWHRRWRVYRVTNPEFRPPRWPHRAGRPRKPLTGGRWRRSGGLWVARQRRTRPGGYLPRGWLGMPPVTA